MFRRGVLAFAAAVLLGTGVAPAQVTVQIAPPRPPVERRMAAPGPGYVWTPGYQRWDGRAYVWVPGTWVRPPRRHPHWVAPRWVHRHGRWMFVEGHWR
jgi:WXXGXW repeat (2 copies)